MKKQSISCGLKTVTFEFLHLRLRKSSDMATCLEAGVWESPAVNAWEVLSGSWQKDMQ